MFAKLSDGVVKHGQFLINIGPIQLKWQCSHLDRDSLIINPANVAVHPILTRKFETKGEQQGVDLKTFLNRDETAEKKHAADEEAYQDPNSPVKHYEASIATHVVYDDTVYILANPNGISSFRFGKAFEREVDAKTKHTGVDFRYTFDPAQKGDLERGTDEVYEVYKDGKYSDGRLNLQAGKVHVQWSVGGSEGGWIYYDPTWTRVWAVAESDASKLIEFLKSR